MEFSIAENTETVSGERSYRSTTQVLSTRYKLLYRLPHDDQNNCRSPLLHPDGALSR